MSHSHMQTRFFHINVFPSQPTASGSLSLCSCTCNMGSLLFVTASEKALAHFSSNTHNKPAVLIHQMLTLMFSRHLSTGCRDKKQGAGGENRGSSAGHRRQPTKARKHEDRAEEVDGCSRWKAR